LAEPFLDVSEVKYLAATSYTIDIWILEESNNFANAQRESL